MLSASVRAGVLIRDLRLALGWTQRTLAQKAGVSQSWICDVERGRCPEASLETIDRLLAAMGGRLIFQVNAPYLATPRQRDLVHARCSAYVARRLARAGWRVAREVEVGGDRSRGWIDILAWHPVTSLLMVIEIKTELHDLGAIERTLGWYEREAWAAARRFGWRPSGVVGSLLVLSTDAVEQRVRDNRSALDHAFSLRASDLVAMVADGTRRGPARARAMATIDPRSRRRVWLRPFRIDGRRTASPYRDYADFVRQDGQAR
jgi:transcriptional regulator with XRE-family HTH domain